MRLSGGSPAVAATVRRRAHAWSTRCVGSIHLALAADQTCRSMSPRRRRCIRSRLPYRRRAAVIVWPAVAGAAAMAELTRRAAARAWVRRRLALVRQADILRLAASWPAGSRGVVGAADQAVVTGAIRSTVTGASLAGASLEVALVLAARSGQVLRGDRGCRGSMSARHRSYPAPRRCSGSHGSCREPTTDPADCSRPRTACRFPVPREDRSGHSRSRGASCRHRGLASQSCTHSRHPVAMDRCRPSALWARRVLLAVPSTAKRLAAIPAPPLRKAARRD